MKSLVSTLVLLAGILILNPFAGQCDPYTVKKDDIFDGYITKKIWLSNYAVPQVSIADIAYTEGVFLPKTAKISDPNKFTVAIGMERKRPFALVHIPAFVAGAQPSVVNQVSSFSLTVTEQPGQKQASAGAKTTDVANSTLATGTWYKIAVTKTGFYKIDYAFLQSMGQDPTSINPANIRVCGMGGNMLAEDNSPRLTDLVENPVQINGNGDAVFDNGESVVFYALGTVAWQKDSVHKHFVHVNNLYTDTGYYFVSFNSGASKQIGQQAALPTGNVNVTTYDFRDSHELDLINPPTLGKLWYGETFSPQLANTTQAFSFNLGASSATAYANVSFASTSISPGPGNPNSCSFSVAVNGTNIGANSFDSPTTGDNVMNIGFVSGVAPCNSNLASVAVSFNAADQGSLGYLYYVEINARPTLSMSGDQMGFRDWLSVGTGNVASYQLQGANSATQVWDVTYPQSPVTMSGTLSGSTYTFTQDAAMLHEFAAMNSSNLYTPKYIGSVPSQNLHGLPEADLIIVTNPAFLEQANELAAHHQSHDHLSTVVATTTQVYNEFSSGAQDATAIRDFARMFYERAKDSTQLPRYLLLFGGASYDYKNRVSGNTNFVPVYESAESSDDLNSFCTDDFFGFLDDNENINDETHPNALDIGVGRLPARSVNDAAAMVNKIKTYDSTSSLGPWRVSTTFVADLGCNDPAGDHMDDAEIMAGSVAAVGANLYNEQKIYVDAIPIVSTPAGQRCPNANAALDAQVFNGTFQINYNGHGNPTVWSSERILTQDDFNNWNNLNSLPFMVTATCDFGQFDHPQFVSSAEQMVVASTGGIIAVLTTTEAVYAYYNVELNQQFLDAQYTRNADFSWNTFGDASRIGKNVTYSHSTDQGELANFRKFSLLGDPAVTPDFPQYAVQLDSVMDGVTLQRADTVKALGSYEVAGSVRDHAGNVMTGFNGIVYVSFYDKPRNITTITGCGEVYQVQDNLVYKGRVTVINGRFSFSFITPKDINYLFGKGKVSTYANTSETDAAGNDSTIAVGGFSDHPVLNTDPPIVKPYINDSLFQNGGITGSNTSLFVTFNTKTGINVSGADVGHDLTAVLDGVSDAPYVLNDYYESAPNTYQYGYVSFPVSGLADGHHSIKVRAWDVNNNVGEGTVDFIVVDGKMMDLQQVGNYPNPFNNETHFVFEQNHPFEQLDVQIEIYSISGALVKNIHENFTSSDSRTTEITWDGTDNGGSRLPSGVYVYRLNVTADKQYRSTAYQKLVISR